MESSPSLQAPAPINPRKAPKSRNGCLRCKAKRLKCDEGKPACIQCTKKNGVCPGYKVKSLVWSTKHERSVNRSGGSRLRSLEIPNIEPPRVTEADEAAGEEAPDTAVSRQHQHKDGERSPPASPSSSLMTTKRRDSNHTDSLSAIRQQLHQSTVPEFLTHLPTMLVEYYFNYVCQIFSSFDGTLNPFRSTVGKLWDGSAPIYYAIQSMAAAYLSNDFPRMLPVGIQMQRETYKCLYQAQQRGISSSENLDKTLLTVLLVGQTTAWHNPGDLGLVHLKTAKRLNRRRIEQQTSQQLVQIDDRAKRQNEFFEQCILYWDMLAGYVEDEADEFGLGEFSILGSESLGGEYVASDEEDKVFPHPWTGISPKVQKLFAQVGRLIRRYRRSVAQETASMNLLSLDLGFDIQYSQDSLATLDAISKAQSLEEELLSFKPPSISKLVDAGDENTPVQQYIDLAEAYRCAALLQIYRIFPSILSQRIPLSEECHFGSTSGTDTANQQLFDFLPLPPSQSPSEFLVSLAIHTTTLLENLPSTSGTRCLQPLIHIVAASELRFSSPSNTDPLSPFVPSTSIFNSLTKREVDIASARRFVVTRLQEFQSSLPAKPIVKALELVKETWARADLGQDVYWMDVMEEMGWASIFG